MLDLQPVVAGIRDAGNAHHLLDVVDRPPWELENLELRNIFLRNVFKFMNHVILSASDVVDRPTENLQLKSIFLINAFEFMNHVILSASGLFLVNVKQNFHIL